MIRFESLTSRIVFLHIVAIALTAIVMPLVLFYLLNSEISQLHRDAMREQAETIARHLAAAPDNTPTLVLPQGLRDQYSDAYGRYAYDVIDASEHVLFSSHRDRTPIFPADMTAADAAFQGISDTGSMIAGGSVQKHVAGQILRVRVAEDLAHRDVITDDIVANFFRRVGWITIPILLLLLATDIFIFRRAITPLLKASEEAKNVGPARTDVRLPVEQIPSEILPLVTAVNQAFDRLEAGFRVQRQFTADAAHELRTPLAILRTRLDTLSDKAATADLHRDIESMSRIVGQLLEIAELDTLVVDPSETADLHAVCSDVVEALAPLALAAGKDIALKGVDDVVAVRGSAEMLRRAIRNLAENAIRHTERGTTVEITIDDDGAVRVSDSGPGIALEQRELIFQRFWRGDRQRADGAGLGLSIVRGVVEDHGATIAVENLPSGGAQFTLRFTPAAAVAG
ncbi:sensor histidine kinase [Bradyrhizobium prioriisuperbiae]|uniref:sensor histidine kinase n=1 Tax=Bradyrhizobium prioriisuperbiae TaxID=2854389 RepID=UPI0028E3E1A0|nr:ATP-binding protein [Bradyrhizobium prioritasuperba]